MDRLIPALNTIRDALASVQLQLGADLPHIAVVGGQSVGKSSVLESFVGESFLPTGAGVVTRRPLLLRLVQGEPNSPKWGEFGHLPGRRIEDFNEIRAEIGRDTEYVCGKQQAISNEPIVLQITSPKVIDLTLIDLPGIARVPAGEQPLDIEQRLRQLVFEHIANPRCFILAVVAGNADLATADALSLAREVDPDGQRTLGVVTKLDLVDSSFDALGVLQGRVYPLRRGFVGVVCRSFQDVKNGKDIKDHLDAEDQFFQSHRTLRSVASQCGIGYLSKRLNQILMDEIQESLPNLKVEVQSLILQQEAELRSHGESVTGRPLSEQGALLLSLFTKFAGRFGDAIEGKLAGEGRDAPGQLVGRARIDFIFRDVFAKTVREFDTFAGLYDDEIRVAIRNATGPRASLFVPEAAFELLVRKQVAKLLAPSLQCAELVFDELQRVLLLSEVPEFRRFASLREQVFGVVRQIMKRCLDPTKQMIRDLIDIEMAYINTSHPSFVGTSAALKAATAGNPGIAANPSTEGKEGTSSERTSPAMVSAQPARSNSGANTLPPLEEVPQAKGQQPSGIFSSAMGFFRPAVKAGAAGTSGEQSVGTVPERSPPLFHRDLSGHSSAGVASALQRSQSSIEGGVLRLPPMPPTIQPAISAPSGRERIEVAILKFLLENYLGIVKKNIIDSVPKTVMHFMVNSLKDTIQSECVARLYREDSFGVLLQEAPEVQKQRQNCSAQLVALNRVVEVTEQLRDFSPDSL